MRELRRCHCDTVNMCITLFVTYYEQLGSFWYNPCHFLSHVSSSFLTLKSVHSVVWWGLWRLRCSQLLSSFFRHSPMLVYFTVELVNRSESSHVSRSAQTLHHVRSLPWSLMNLSSLYSACDSNRPHSIWGEHVPNLLSLVITIRRDTLGWDCTLGRLNDDIEDQCGACCWEMLLCLEKTCRYGTDRSLPNTSPIQLYLK